MSNGIISFTGYATSRISPNGIISLTAYATSVGVFLCLSVALESTSASKWYYMLMHYAYGSIMTFLFGTTFYCVSSEKHVYQRNGHNELYESIDIVCMTREIKTCPRKRTSHPRVAHGQRYPMPCLRCSWRSGVRAGQRPQRADVL